MDPLFFTLFWVFGFLGFGVLVWHLRASHRQKRMELIHRERMTAMEKGVPLPELPEYGESAASSLIAEAVASIKLNPRWPLGIGALSTMVGMGTCLALRLSGDEYHRQMASFGLIGVFLGIGLILHYLLTRPRPR